MPEHSRQRKKRFKYLRENIVNDISYDYGNNGGGDDYYGDGDSSAEGKCDFFCQLSAFGSHVQQTVTDVLSSTECFDRSA